MIEARAGVTTHAAIRVERMPGAPVHYQLGDGTGVTDISGNGRIAVGNYGRGGLVFRWAPDAGLVSMNVPSTRELTAISRNGAYISTDILEVAADGSLGAYRWDARNGWIPTAQTGSCDSESTVNFAVDDHGSVYGLTYNSCTDYKAWPWNPRHGSVVLRSSVMSRNGDAMAGFSGNPYLSFNPGPFIWTRQMGTVNLDHFLRSQGTAMEQWYSLWEPIAMSDDGRTIGDFGIGFLGYAGWVVHIDRAFVCHHEGGDRHGAAAAGRTWSVEFTGEREGTLCRWQERAG